MATFTHTTTWTVTIDGRATTYTFSYDIEDVIDVQRVSKDASSTEVFEMSSEPVCIFAVGRSSATPSSVGLTDNGTVSGVTTAYLREGEMFVSHLADGGGTWNSSGVNNTATLKPADSVSIGSIGVAYAANFDLLILHQAAS